MVRTQMFPVLAGIIISIFG